MFLLNRLIVTGLALGLSAGAASAASYTFSHGGFAEGATVSGTFAGVDTDNDGLLTYFRDDIPILIDPDVNISATNELEAPPQEITSFSGTFSGNSLVPSFSFGLSDLAGFVWDLNDGNLIGDGFPESESTAEGIAVSLGGLLLAANLLENEVLGFAWDVGPGPAELCNGIDDCGGVFVFGEQGVATDFSTQAVVIAPVPLPASALLLALGMGGLAIARRRAA